MKRRCIAPRRFLHERKEKRAGDTCHAPGGQDGSVNRGELLHAEEIGEEGRHAGEAAAVAGDHGEYQYLEEKRITDTGKCIKAKTSNAKKIM